MRYSSKIYTHHDSHISKQDIQKAHMLGDAYHAQTYIHVLDTRTQCRYIKWGRAASGGALASEPPRAHWIGTE